MKKTKTILLVVLVSCIVLGAAMCIFKREQTKEEIIQEYQQHKEAFEYVKEYFIANNISQIRKDSDKITILSNIITPLEEMNDKLLVQYVHVLFDDLHYFRIFSSSAWKENVMQLMFKKETNKTYYYKEIVYCEDNEPPISTSAVFYDVEQIEKYWFYCEADEDENLF